MLDGPDGTTRREFIAWVAGIAGGFGIGRALPKAAASEAEPRRPVKLVRAAERPSTPWSRARKAALVDGMLHEGMIGPEEAAALLEATRA